MVIPVEFTSLLNALLILISSSGIIGYAVYLWALLQRRDAHSSMIRFLAVADLISIYRFIKISIHLVTGNPYWESNLYVTALCGLGAPLVSMYLEWLIIFQRFREKSSSSALPIIKWIAFIVTVSVVTSLLPFWGIGAYESLDSPPGFIKFGCHLDFKRRAVQAPLMFAINSICAAVPIMMWLRLKMNSNIPPKSIDTVMQYAPYLVIFSYVPYMVLCVNDMFTDYRWIWFAEILPHFLPKIMLAVRPFFYLLADEDASQTLKNIFKSKQT